MAIQHKTIAMKSDCNTPELLYGPQRNNNNNNNPKKPKTKTVNINHWKGKGGDRKKGKIKKKKRKKETLHTRSRSEISKLGKPNSSIAARNLLTLVASGPELAT